ncbi:MAG: class I SAM-dependent methyltransferase [Vicinamibacterales bacterium]
MTPHPPPFDQAQRYEVVAALARESGARTILDVGGFHKPAGKEPPLPVRSACPGLWAAVVDVQAPEPDTPGTAVRYVRGDAYRLPLASRSFDVVSCLDVVEHVPRELRPGVVSELLRVARDYVIVCCPTADDGAAEEERVVSGFVRNSIGAEQEQLAEHERFGLPSNAEMIASLPAETRTFGFGSLACWRLMMLAKYAFIALPHSAAMSAALDAGYQAHAGKADRVPPFYRRFYLAPARDDAPLAPIEAVLSSFAPLPSSRPVGEAALAAWVFSLLVEADPARRAAERSPLEEKIAALEGAFQEVESSLVYRLYRLFRR